ncbi:MAG: hypothetical protein JW987_16365 [Anaerolineaceae bacterium]|nr:hypothetical protein [Anaerolineaceae bacterium]
MDGAEQRRRHSIRLKEYDYASAGAYFVTLVTHGRECLFGEIREDEVVLNPTGKMICQEWERLSSRFSEVELDEFVIMPNHVHGIIMIKEKDTEPTSLQEGAAPGLKDSDPGRTSLRPYGAAGAAGAAGSLGAIVRAFKSAAVLRFNRMRFASGKPLWQRNYYEHIVRDEKDLQRIRLYIRDNPLRWSLDENNPTARRGT